MKPLNQTRRFSLLLVALGLWSGVIVARLVWLQVYQHAEFVAKANQQQQKSTQIPARRGTIYDRTGKPLAQTLEADAVVADPQLMPDLKAEAAAIAKVLNLKPSDIVTRLRDAREKAEIKASAKAAQAVEAGKEPSKSVKVLRVVVAHKLTPLESEKLHALKLPGITFEPEMRRYFPRGELAAHVLGSVGYVGQAGEDQNEVGTAGLERSFEKELAGHAGKEKIFRDSKQRGYDSQQVEETVDGTSLTLTIDPNIQYQAEFGLRDAVKTSGAHGGVVVALDPYTGEVLAMASYPTYDPNLPQGPGNAAEMARANQAVTTKYEPGSVFKVITLAAALENTNLTPQSTFFCGGSINVAGRIIKDHKSFGSISMAQVLAHSSNVGAIRIALETKPEPLYATQKKFGFGAKTGVELPAESTGRLWPVERWTPSSIGSLAMGHEVSVTAVQLAVAGAAIANGGLKIKPHLVMARQHPGQPAEKVPSDPGERILRPETAIEMRQMMEGVVLAGTGSRAVLTGYTSGGKTGTAQIFDFKTKKYTHDYNASFMGFAPVTNPRIVIVVSLFGTKGGESAYGGVQAAPIFKRVAMSALRVMDVPRDLQSNRAPDLASLDFDENDLPSAFIGKIANQNLIASALQPQQEEGNGLRAQGDGDLHKRAKPPEAVASHKHTKTSAPSVIATRKPSVSSVTLPLAQSKNPVSDSGTSQRPFLTAMNHGGMNNAGGGNIQVPNFGGMTLRSVLQRSAATGVEVQISGSGVALTQDPPAGSSLRAGSVVRVQFGN